MTATSATIARTQPARPARPARPPRSRPAAQSVAVLLGLVLVGLAVVGVHDLTTARGWSRGRPWVPDLVDRLDGSAASTGVVVGSVAVVVVGVLLLAAAVLPGRRTHLRVAGEADLWVSPDAVGALARASADRAPGVVSADVARATRRRVVVEVVTQREGDDVTAGVHAALAGSLAELTGTRVAVRTTELPR